MRIGERQLQRVLDRAGGGGRLGQAISEALQVIDDVLDDYGEEHVAMSFNGGKDCTVLVHLLAAALYRRNRSKRPEAVGGRYEGDEATVIPESTIPANDHNARPPPPPTSPLYRPIIALYITAPNPFPALETFVASSAEYYALDLQRYGGGGMKRALAEFQDSERGRGVRAFFVGTRRGDPHGASLQACTPTDPGWPPFMRVHPILDWSYNDVWAFLRDLEVPYCSLYDEGYTSLGSIYNTHPNPLLRNPERPSGYDPAYLLQDESKERAGRDDVPRPEGLGILEEKDQDSLGI